MNAVAVLTGGGRRGLVSPLRISSRISSRRARWRRGILDNGTRGITCYVPTVRLRYALSSRGRIIVVPIANPRASIAVTAAAVLFVAQGKRFYRKKKRNALCKRYPIVVSQSSRELLLIFSFPNVHIVSKLFVFRTILEKHFVSVTQN